MNKIMTHPLALIDGSINIIIILLAGYIASKIVTFLIKKAFKNYNDNLTIYFLERLFRWLVIIITVSIALTQLGVSSASFVTVFGTIALGFALAMKDSLMDLSAGVMMLIYKPFKTNDYIATNTKSGKVTNVGLFNLSITTFQNEYVILPNSKVWNNHLVNYSYFPVRRLDIIINISYDDDIDKALEVMKKVHQESSYFIKAEQLQKDQGNSFLVDGLNSYSIDLCARMWANNGDYLSAKSQYLRNIKLAFDKANITIPFPQRTIHVNNDK